MACLDEGEDQRSETARLAPLTRSMNLPAMLRVCCYKTLGQRDDSINPMYMRQRAEMSVRNWVGAKGESGLTGIGYVWG